MYSLRSLRCARDEEVNITTQRMNVKGMGSKGQLIGREHPCDLAPRWEHDESVY